MRIEYENIAPDSGSSFKMIHWKSLNDRFFWHQHPEYEIIFIKKGTGKLHIGNHLGRYEEGEVMFLGPNLPHTGLGYGVTEDHEEIIIQLKKDFLGENFLNAPEFKEIVRLFDRAHLGITFNGAARKIVARKMQTMLNLSNFDRLMMLLTIFKTLSETTEYTILNAADSSFEFRHQEELRINNIYDYVEKNYQAPIKIEVVAEIANLTVPSFCRYFKKMTHMTFTDFVNEFRVNNACKLLMEDKSVSEICFESGFSNLSHFNKTFKVQKGVSPSQFKKEIKKV